MVIRLAIYMFGSRPSADPETPEAWELDPGMDAGQCLQRFVHEVMASRLPKVPPPPPPLRAFSGFSVWFKV